MSLRRLLLTVASAGLPAGALWMAGCGDDEVFRATDAAAYEGGALVDGGSGADGSGSDAASALGCGNATGAPPRLLLSVNRATDSELAAFDLSTAQVDGRLTYAGSLGLASAAGRDPYLLEQRTDLVARLDAQRPWEVVSSWSVAGDDAADGGLPYANPSSVVVPDCGKGFVFRYHRNKVAILDTTRSVEAGAPSSYLDLASLVQPHDSDGFVEMAGALYIPTRTRIYVLLGNQDLKKVASDGFTALCTDTVATVVAIDPSTSELVSLGGAGMGGGIVLGGYGPVLGTPMIYDSARERLLVLTAGCNTDNGGAPGAIQRRRVEEVDLATGGVRTLLALDAPSVPSGLVYADGTHAAITFSDAAFLWDPSQPVLGARIAGGLAYGASDGKGNAVGARTTTLADGGEGPIEIVRVPLGAAGADAGVVKLGEAPFTTPGGFLSGAELWPHP